METKETVILLAEPRGVTPQVAPRSEASLIKIRLIYILYHQPSSSESPVKIGIAVPENSWNKQRDNNFKKMLF